MATQVQSAKRPHPLGGLYRAERRFILLAVIPTLVFFLVFQVYPVVQAFYMSLHDWQLMREQQPFVGLVNYQTVLSDPVFQRAIENTLIFAFATSIGSTVLGLGVAFLMQPINFGSSILRLLYFLPTITVGIGVFVVWRWLYNPRSGLFNQILLALGIAPVNWLGSPNTALLSIIIMSIWGGLGFSALILLSGIKNIPGDYYEAARVDGASPWQMNLRITIPLINPIITFVFITSLIGAFNVFSSVYILTGGTGGPLDSTQVIVLQIYQNAFQRLWMGIASAMAFILFLIVFGVTLLQMRLRRAADAWVT